VKTSIPFTDKIEIAGAVQNAATYRLSDLQAEPATTEAVYFNTGAGPVSATFTGVLLWTLLQKAVIKIDPSVKNDILRHAIAVIGTDGYSPVLSAGELAPNVGGELAIIAYAQDGKPLGPDQGGFARLIVPGDKVGGRNLSSVARIEVR
jgi:DMSO/TMAO reductase YedYZ molybdopterin-dependent catalytic subunit